MIRRGQTLVRVLLGPWAPAEGVDVPGIAGPVWYYASCYLELDSGEIYELGPRSIEEVSRPNNTTTINDTDLHLPSPIEDVIVDESDEVRVVLQAGTYLENAYLPGGSRVSVGHFSEWSAEELDEEVTSLIDGRKSTARAFLSAL
jgi:hypothetical protein